MSTLKVNNLQNTSGGSSSTPEEIEQGRAKAYVHVNGITGTFVRQSFGVSSVNDNGTGSYTINFSTAFADNEYIMVAGSTNDGHSRGGFGMQTGRNTTDTTVFCTSHGNNNAHDVRAYWCFFGDQ
jgi:hypothetical protein|tara:strand:+ start:205 stop:579 length:375 start_codon:yes stop_codon:yes gene_type:complete